MAHAEQNLPTRTMTEGSDDEAVPEEDTGEVTKLFHERLKAWKHAVGYLEDYVGATEKMQHAHGKEYEKVLKTVSHPLKEGHHFDQSVGGVAGMFDNIRSNTQGISNSHYDAAKALKGSVLPIFERLHSEIKHKTKELTKGAGKGSKAVDKARNATQKQIELLGQHTATFDSAGGTVKASDDPYILQRKVMHHLYKQVAEENANRADLLAVQNSFSQFEAHVLQTIQSGLGQFLQIVSSQADNTKAMYGDMVGTAQHIPRDFEWKGFAKRNSNVLIDESAPERSVSSISFPNQSHRATQPLIAGSLEKKSKVLRKYEPYYYVVTPAKFLHEFKSDDDQAHDPSPELSLYLPDCLVGALDGQKFNVKGKDVSKGALSKLSLSHELQFRAHSPADAQQWHDVIRSVAGGSSGEMPEGSAPSSPVASRTGTSSSYGEGADKPYTEGYGERVERPHGEGYGQGGEKPYGRTEGYGQTAGHGEGVERPYGQTSGLETEKTAGSMLSAGPGQGTATYDAAKGYGSGVERGPGQY